MASPFIYEQPVAGDALIDRRSELAALVDRAADARNTRLEGPRRFGKTSLLRVALASAGADGAIPIEVNFLGCVSSGDVADRIERAYGEQLDSTLRRWYDGLVRTLRPTFSAAPGGVGAKAQPQALSLGLLDRLALPRRVHERTGRTCVIAFDEFQEVLRVSDGLPGVFRSELERHADAAAYIFSGSHPGLMREMFADRRSAFFGQATPVTLGPLPADELGEFIDRRFVENGRATGEALGALLDACEGHPQRAMLLAHHLYELTDHGTTADIESWWAALDGAAQESLGEIQILWDSVTDLERRVMKVVAERTVALGSREAEARFGLAKGGSSRLAIDRLYADGHLMPDESTRTGWRVVDPFLADWLRTG